MRKIQKNFKVSEEEDKAIREGAASVDRSQTGFILWLVKRFSRKRAVNSSESVVGVNDAGT